MFLIYLFILTIQTNNCERFDVSRRREKGEEGAAQEERKVKRVIKQ
jgi:hypothetical protein